MKPWAGRKPDAMRPFGPMNSMVPASPASAPEMRKLDRPSFQSLAPCHSTIVPLRPARLARTPKAVRLTRSHIKMPTAAAIAMMVGDRPSESEMR
ncbi:hypothetical protein FQZ97_1080740 [compost metagenome]